jgi:NitT/TauT family transport system ATP-binding protein
MENTSMSSNDILVIDNLSKIYHTNNSEITAIKDLNLNIKDGEFVAIVGPSGCGKTTLLSILCGLENKSSGNILFPKGKAKMGYMLQNDTLFPWLNILDNSLLGLKVQKKITKENKDKVISMLNTYGSQVFNLNLVISGIIILMIVSYLMYIIVSYIEKILVKND